MEIRGYILGQGNIGWLIALIVLILCVVLMVVGKSVSNAIILTLIAGVALSRLL